MSKLAERHKHILDAMARDGLVKVADLAESLGVTPTTIRKDLNILESKGLLFRAYGGALPNTKQIMDINLKTKKKIDFEDKKKIAEAACQLVEENDSIIIASGSTLSIFADSLVPKGRLNIVTTAVNISTRFGEMPGVTVMQIGGLLYSNTLSVIGHGAVNAIRNVFCNKAFLGIDGFDPEYGITCAAVEEAEVCRQMVLSAKRTIILTDSSKFGNRGLARICDVKSVSTIITDDKLPEEYRKIIEGLGIELIIV